MNKDAMTLYVCIGLAVSAGALSAAKNSTGGVIALLIMAAYWIGLPCILGSKYEKEEAERKIEEQRKKDWHIAELERERKNMKELPCPKCGSTNINCLEDKSIHCDPKTQLWYSEYMYTHICWNCNRRWYTSLSGKEVFSRPVPLEALTPPQCSNCLSNDTELEKKIENKDSNTVIYYYYCKGCGKRWTKVQTKEP